MLSLVNPERFSLLELLDEGFVKGDLVLKGSDNEPAVLVTDSETFGVRQVLTSNTLLLVDPISKETISLNAYLELVKMQPRLEKLLELLDAYPYKGPLEETRMASRQVRHSQLTKSLQIMSLF